MTFTDTHTHSDFSRDSITTVAQSVRAAISSRLTGISFTDHLDIGVPQGSVGDYFEIGDQQAAIQECVLKYGTCLGIYAGVEVGLQKHCLNEIQKIISAHRFDIVIGSIHWVNHLDPYCGEYYVNKSIKEAYREYMEFYIDCIGNYNDFDVLGHYDYISRYSPYKEKTLLYRDFKDHFDTFFKIAIEKGKALELNTRSFLPRNGQPPPQFDPDVFKRYRELGGEMVTLGSNAHDTQRLGDNFELFAAKLKKCGLRYLTHFKERKPVLTPNEL
ncbi:MAG: histidinol-phosphatase HisJ family protein [Prevotellaceae bacterium]|jgi:histidinol-phosphatase (PHP family)|nr:histidinol-phosphatase HisJ family protein [Prevotellaceae bacterium]